MADQEKTRVILHGIGYRIQRPDAWTVVFIEETPIGGPGCATRFMMHKPRHGIWQYYGPEKVPACHIGAAYEWCKARWQRSRHGAASRSADRVARVAF